MRAEYEQAERDLVPLLAEYQAAGEGPYDIAAARLLGEDLISMNRLSEAEEYIDLALARSLESGDRWSRTELLAIKAWLAARRGRLDEADATLAEALETLRESDYAANGAYYQMLGLVRAMEARDAEAEAAFRRSIRAVDVSDNWAWQMSALDLAEFLLSRGRHEEAAALVERVSKAVEGTDLNIVGNQLGPLKAQLEGQPASRGNL